MSKRELKDAVHKLIEQSDDDQLLEEIYEILNQNRKVDILDELSPEQLESLNRALKDVETGNVISHEEAQKRIKLWLSK